MKKEDWEILVLNRQLYLLRIKKLGIDISSSAIRNILANLQKEGLLFAPHISSGRLPTDKGMRYFVDGLLEFGRLSKNAWLDEANI